MGQVHFVRHGQASFGTDDYDRLSPLGWQQARWLGRHLSETGHRYDAVVSGGMRRHRETAQAIAEELHLPDAMVAQGLNEMDFDLLLDDAVAGGFIASREFADSDAFAHAFPRILRGWEDQAFPTRHEPFRRFLERVHEAVDAVAEHGRTVLIVSSGGPKAVLMRRVFGMETEAMADLLLGILNSSVSRFNVGKDGLDLAEFNAVPHLSAPDRAHAKTFI